MRKFYDIKYLGRNSITYKYGVYEKGTLITEFLSSEEINIKNKAVKRETIKELSDIIERYNIKGI